MIKLLTIVGARPQFIKAAVLSRAIRNVEEVREIIVHTGQHYDEQMSEVFFEELDIPRPKYNLGVGSGMHGVQTGKMLAGVEQILLDERPDWVVVYGDTNSTLAGALAAAKLNLPVAHVEAGLRSFNRRMPEEVNRVLVDHVSTVLFAPSATAVRNLANEGIFGSSVVDVGDVMFDAVLYYGKDEARTSEVLGNFGLQSGQYVLATIHRAENTDDLYRLKQIFSALAEVAKEMTVLLPLHPRTRACLARIGTTTTRCPGLILTDPVGYLDMIQLEKNAALVCTDSGGVQKEAYFFRVPCVTLRDETEWIELVELGWNRLVSPSTCREISSQIIGALGTAGAITDIYGHGDSGNLILNWLRLRA